MPPVSAGGNKNIFKSLTQIMTSNSTNVNTAIDSLGTTYNSESFLTTANVPNSGTQGNVDE